jgi:signal transduction histidine kinase
MQTSAAVSFLRTQPWMVVFVQPQEVFLSLIRAQAQNTWILAAVIAAGVASVAVVLAYTLAVPIVRLTRAAESVARGDLTVRARVKSHDEIGLLATTFNSMTRQLQDTLAGLEQRVAERTRAERTAQDHATRLHTLAGLSQVISSSLHHDGVLHEIAKAAGQLMEVPFVTFWVADEATQRLEAGAFVHEAIGASFPLRHLSFDEGAVGWVAKHQCIVNIPDITRDPRFVISDWWVQQNLRSFFGVPIVGEKALLAVLVLGSSTPFQFDAVAQSVLDSFIAQAAITLQNAQLFHKFHIQARHLTQSNEDLHREIAQRVQTETELRRRTAQLEAANAELDAFAYSISHDLRAPLRSLSGFSQALMEDYSDQLTGDALDYLTRIGRASQRMSQMIDDLLTLSRATRGELRWEQVNLSKLARTIATTLGEYDPDRQISWHIEPKVVVQGDPRLLRMVLENLLHNAWKFTSKHATATIAFGTRQVNGETVYFVRDDGVGFNMAYAHKLFGIFQRLHSMTEFEGTGIGLATVARLIHRHGGRVWAEAAQGQGATFYFTL